VGAPDDISKGLLSAANPVLLSHYYFYLYVDILNDYILEACTDLVRNVAPVSIDAYKPMRPNRHDWRPMTPNQRHRTVG